MGEKGKKFYIQEHLQKNVFHGGVGNIDVERILLANGYTAIEFPFHYNFSVKAKLHRYIFLIKQVLSIPAGAIVFFQFPLYARMHKLLLHVLKLRPSIRVICLIADINGLKDGDDKLLQQEVSTLSHFQYFIVHGKVMEGWLKTHVPGAFTAPLNFFDFLVAPAATHRNLSPVICFAGNLAKSSFIEKLHLVTETDPELRFLIYGPDATREMVEQPGVEFKGKFPPYQLPSVIEGAFGLLWDGSSIEGAGGSLGDYMQFISHHKLSLYILAGMPLIVYDKAGSAAMVKELKIGVTVQSIHDIASRISKITDEEYQLMRINMRPIADRISKGENLLNALEKMYEAMK